MMLHLLQQPSIFEGKLSLSWDDDGDLCVYVTDGETFQKAGFFLSRADAAELRDALDKVLAEKPPGGR